MQLHLKFIQTAKALKDKTAIIDRTTGRQLSYQKALIASLILADKFSRFEPGFLGLMLPTSAGCILSIIGSLMSGRVPVMINYSTDAASNAVFAQRKCSFKKIITSRALLEKIGCPKSEDMIFIEDIMGEVSHWDKIKAAVKAVLPVSLLTRYVHQGSDSETLVVLFTSGSENEPKAVPLSHRNIGSNVQALSEVFDLSADDKFLANLPLFHVLGQTANLWLPLHYGMKVITYANPLDFKMICRIVREEEITLMAGTPSFFRGYLQKSNPGDFKSVRIAIAGADKVPDTLREGFMSKHGLTLYEGYGATETSPVISVNTPSFNRPGSVGKVLPNVKVRIQNMETGADLPPNQKGKILVKGQSVMTGYYKAPDLLTFLVALALLLLCHIL